MWASTLARIWLLGRGKKLTVSCLVVPCLSTTVIDMIVAIQLILLWLLVFFLGYWVYALQEKLKEQDSLIGEMIVVMGKIVDKVSK